MTASGGGGGGGGLWAMEQEISHCPHLDEALNVYTHKANIFVHPPPQNQYLHTLADQMYALH